MANSGFGLCLIVFGVTFCMDTPLNEIPASNDVTRGNKNGSLPIMLTTGNVSSIENEQFSKITKNNSVQQNGSIPVSQSTPMKINTTDTAQKSRPVLQSTIVNKTDEMTLTTVNDGANVDQPTGSQLASQSSGPVSQPTTTHKPEEEITTAMPTTVNNGASVTQPTGSELTSKSSGPVPHPTIVNKPGEEITTARPTTVNNGASVTQPTGSELPSQTPIVNQAVDGSLPSKVKASVTKPSALNIVTTAKKFLQADKKVAAKPAVDDGHFIIYLILGSLLVSLVYITYHNKNKIISLCRRGGPRRTGRPNASEYQRLDQNLSEVMTILKKKTSLKMN
ncbi:keratinocyte-associated transmembrane protein 2-like [Leucoraja erinacea]|uniref:keratinocyte-associated transmembrane protein 2-like n=1 Tax=Leucoraja erinaceus TaxID=7782 RepID=UPI0024561529|nr:keratinocyte-associated transmembrane protein 2-like [Leucoraja erinacea]